MHKIDSIGRRCSRFTAGSLFFKYIKSFLMYKKTFINFYLKNDRLLKIKSDESGQRSWSISSIDNVTKAKQSAAAGDF